MMSFATTKHQMTYQAACTPTISRKSNPLSALATMKTPKEYKQSVDNGVVTPKIIGDVIFSLNKRAKNMRNQERYYRNLYRGSGWSDRYDSEEKYREKKEQYYQKKEKLLEMLNPTHIHVTEEKVFSTVSEDFDGYDGYEYHEDYEVLETFQEYNQDIREYETYMKISYRERKYFLFYEIGGRSFHTPIDFIPKDNHLPIVKLEKLTTYGEDIGKLLSVQFCNKVLDGLISEKLSIDWAA